MPFRSHLDRLRQEVIKDVGGTLRFWPRVDGQGNVAIDASPTYVLLSPAGATLASGTATRTAVDAVHRIDVAVSAGLAATLDEGYQLRLTWTHTGGASYTSLVLWDVVRFPYASNPLVSLSDLQELRPTIDERLERFGEFMGLTNNEEADEAASLFAYNAREELSRWIKSAANQQGTTRPALILDRTALAAVERLLALALIFEADARGPGDPDDGGSDDEASSLARYYRGAAKSAWASMQPLPYDSDEDGVEDTQIRPGSSAIVTVRGGWGGDSGIIDPYVP